MRGFKTCILTSLLVAGSGVAQVHWQPIEPGAGSFLMSAAIRPDNPDIMYVGGDIEGLFKTVDGGRTWSNAGPGVSDSPAGAYAVQEIVIDPADFQRLYAATWSGLYRSEDGGGSWEYLFPQLDPEDDEIPPVSYVAVDPADPQIIYAGIGDSDRDDGGTGSLYRSEDGGQSWERLEVQMDEVATVHGLVVDPGSPSSARRLFTSTSDGLFRSEDGGANWERINSGLPHMGARRLEARNEDGILVLYLSMKTTAVAPDAFNGGVYKSVDGGDSWTSINGDLPNLPEFAEEDTPYYDYWKIALHPDDDQVVYAATNLGGWGPDWGVYRTVDGGDTWIKLDSEIEYGWLEPGWWNDFNITVLKIAPSDPDVLISGGDFLHRSNDGGQTWQQSYADPVGQGWKGNGLELMVAFDFGFDPDDANLWYLGYDDMGLWQSTDAGQSFAPLDPEQVGEYDDATSIVVNPADGTVFVGRNRGANDEEIAYTGGRVMRSSDRGATFTTLTGLPAGRPVLAIGPDEAIYCGIYGQGTFRSQDGGENWVNVSDGLGEGAAYVWALDISATGIIYLALNTLSGSGPGGIFKSANGGDEWMRMHEGDDVLSIAVDPLDDQIVYAGTTDDYSWSTTGGVLKSVDGGQSWTRVFFQPRGGIVLTHPSIPGLVMTASQPWWNYSPEELTAGLYLSDDAGNSWTDVSQGLGHRFALGARFNPHDPNQILVATHGGGVWLGRLDVDTPTNVAASTLPSGYTLMQNFPNPFNPATAISYELGEASHVALKIFDTAGQRVRVLIDGYQERGVHRTIWDGRTEEGMPVANGVYFYQLRAGAFSQMRKMVLTK